MQSGQAAMAGATLRTSSHETSAVAPPPRPVQDRLFKPAFVGLVALTVLPLWVSRFLPMVDLPQHLAMINVLHHLDDPGLRFKEFFTAKREFVPYLGYYWTVHLLTFALPIEIANRLFLSAYAVGMAMAALGLARALERSPWLALFALPLTYTSEFYLGFVNYIAGLALMLGALAVYAARLHGRIEGRGWDALMLLLPLACVATHPHPYSFFVAALAVLVVALPGRRQRALGLAAPSLVLFVWWLRQYLGRDRYWGAPFGHLRYDPIAERISRFSGHVLDVFRDSLDSWLLVAFAALLGWALVAALRHPRTAAQPWSERMVAPALASGALGGYFLMPTHMPLIWYIDARYATLACLLLALAVPLVTAPKAWRNALIGLCTLNSVYLVVQFRRFDAEAGDFRALAEQVEANSCIGAIAGYMDTSVIRDAGAFNHFAAYVSLWRGVIPGYSFAAHPHSPLAFKRRDGSRAEEWRDAAVPVIMLHREQHHVRQGTTYEAYGAFYRYFLVPRSRQLAELFGPSAGKLTKLGEAGPLALYLNPAGRCGR